MRRWDFFRFFRPPRTAAPCQPDENWKSSRSLAKQVAQWKIHNFLFSPIIQHSKQRGAHVVVRVMIFRWLVNSLTSFSRFSFDKHPNKFPLALSASLIVSHIWKYLLFSLNTHFQLSYFSAYLSALVLKHVINSRSSTRHHQCCAPCEAVSAAAIEIERISTHGGGGGKLDKEIYVFHSTFATDRVMRNASTSAVWISHKEID